MVKIPNFVSMCGIAGIFTFNDQEKNRLNRISDATYSLLKRGPDDEGLFFDNNIALGHRRLSIIDTSKGASQPMIDSSGNYIVVFNGELFNYRELRRDLEAKGIVFKTQSDTEVLLYSYVYYGESCLQNFDGEFAFAVYNKLTQTLFAARDRFGIKPFFYYYEPKAWFGFASELKAIVKMGLKPEIDPDSLAAYFQLNYIPGTKTIYQNIVKLAPGNYLLIQNGELSIKPYYKVQSNVNFTGTYADAQAKLVELLDHSVRNRMISDVPLGSFLSGGIDSSVITALASRYTKKLHTFSVGYKDEPLFDETRYAQLVSKKWGTDHTVFSLSNDDLFSSLFSMLDYFDEPFADSSALAVYILSKNTRKHVTVALSGDGADELFAGYNKHQALHYSMNSSLATYLKYTTPLFELLPKSRNSFLGNKFRQLQKMGEGMKLSLPDRYWRWASISGINEVEKLIERTGSINSIQSNFTQFISNDFNSSLLADVKLVLENDMLVKVDRMSMANSLEVRVPFLDHQVVDFAFSLPVSFKIDSTGRKRILKDAFKDQLPPEIFQRGKQGFEVPLLSWFKKGLKTVITDELLNDNFIKEQGLFNVDEVIKLKKQLFSSDPNDSVAKVWALIVFQYWYKNTFLKF